MNVLNRQTIVAISGSKNSGKTHFIEGLVKLLSSADIPFAVVKHDAHAHMKIDHEGKDSWRYRNAGAPIVAIVGPSGTAILDYSSKFKIGDDVKSAFQQLPLVEIIVAEGFKDHRLPRIGLVAEGGERASEMVIMPAACRHDEINYDNTETLSVKKGYEFILGLARTSGEAGND